MLQSIVKHAPAAAFSRRLNIRTPIIQAPMAGGVTTPRLVAAVSNCGALGSYGAGYLSPSKLREGIREIKALTNKPFAVNLFVPQAVKHDAIKIERTNKILNIYRHELDIKPEPYFEYNEDQFEEKISIILSENIPIFSFTFGIPKKEIVAKLKEKNIILIGTATTVAEGIEIEKAGCDVVVGQGSDAGGHRGTFLSSFSTSQVGTMSLIPQLVSHISLPVIAAGGIMDGRGVVASLALGASGVQMGTAFMTCLESGINEAYRKALLSSNEESTVVTPVFSGKPARGIKNRFIEEMSKQENDIPDYPILNQLTQDIRAKASALKRPEFLSLWAGQATRLSRTKTAAELIAEVEKEAAQTLQTFQKSK
jgi:nitronate monooxygenase